MTGATAYGDLIANVLLNGETVRTRNSVVKRITTQTVKFDHTPLVVERKTAWKLALREMEWFLSGSNRIDDLHPSVRHWWQPFCTVDKHTLSYNYGQCLRRLYAVNGRQISVEPKHLVDGPIPIPKWELLPVKVGEDKHLGYVGKNHHGDTFRVIDYKEGSYYVVQFDSNGYTTLSQPGNFLKGIIKNPYYPTMLDVGCYGVVNKDDYTYYTRAYHLWCDVMNRCYNPARSNYRWYGQAGIKVSPRWRCFEYFIHDLSRVLGFEEWLLNPGKYHLDKDYYKSDYYGLDSCVFLPGTMNQRLAHVDDGSRVSLFVDQIEELVDGVKNHPNSRRNILTTWVPPHVSSGLMNPTNCHNTVTQAFVDSSNRLSLSTYQRSVDVVCGLPHNWIQMWAFLLWLAHRTGRQVGSLEWVGGDIHIYEQHFELADKIVAKSWEVIEPPTLVYEPNGLPEFKADHFHLDGEYKYALSEKAEMVV